MLHQKNNKVLNDKKHLKNHIFCFCVSPMKIVFLSESLTFHVYYSWNKAQVPERVCGSSALEHDHQHDQIFGNFIANQT